MKRIFSMMTIIFASVAFMMSCGEKKLPNPEIGELETYQDPATKFEIKYPKGWLTAKENGRRFIAYSSKEGQHLFQNLMNIESIQEVPAAKIDFLVIKVEPEKSVEKIIEETKTFDAKTYSEPESLTIDGVPAIKQKYSFEFGASSKYQGEIYYVTKDSQLVNIITIEDVGGNFETLKPKFNEIINSVKVGVLPEVKVIKKDSLVEEPGPTATFIQASGQGFGLQIPDNFHLSNVGSRGGSETSFNISGNRRGDCYIQVDIIDTKGNNLEKITEDNKGKFGGSFTKTTFGGAKATVFNWNVRKDLDTKVYFAVHNNKWYRVIVSYYKPEANLFKDAFAKMTQTFKFQ